MLRSASGNDQPREHGGYVASFRKSAGEVVVGSLCEYREEKWFDIRVCVASGEAEDEVVRTKKGVFLRIEELPKLGALLEVLSDSFSRDKLAGAITRNSREEVRVGLQEFKGTATVYVRTYARKRDGEWIPTQKGVTLAVNRLPSLREMVDRLIEEAVEAGWMSMEGNPGDE